MGPGEVAAWLVVFLLAVLVGTVVTLLISGVADEVSKRRKRRG